MDVEITKDGFAAAIKRHEDEFEKELSEVDVKKIVLKTKKALLEQIHDNAIMKNTIANQTNNMRDFNSRIAGFEDRVEKLEKSLEKSNISFKLAVELLAQAEEYINKPWTERMKDYWFFWLK